jgi:hypothetical protein
MGLMNRFFKKKVGISDSEQKAPDNTNIQNSEEEEPARDAHEAMKRIAQNLNVLGDALDDALDENPELEEEIMKRMKKL